MLASDPNSPFCGADNAWPITAGRLAKILEFEKAAKLRDQIEKLKKM